MEWKTYEASDHPMRQSTEAGEYRGYVHEEVDGPGWLWYVTMYVEDEDEPVMMARSRSDTAEAARAAVEGLIVPLEAEARRVRLTRRRSRAMIDPAGVGDRKAGLGWETRVRFPLPA